MMTVGSYKKIYFPRDLTSLTDSAPTTLQIKYISPAHIIITN